MAQTMAPGSLKSEWQIVPFVVSISMIAPEFSIGHQFTGFADESYQYP
jgi:hypothetical protein